MTINYTSFVNNATVKYEIKTYKGICKVRFAKFAEKVEETLYEEKTTKVKHKVKKGDSLSKIAKDQKTTVDAIKKENKLKNDSINISQELTITTTKKVEKGKNVTFKRINSGFIRDEVYLVVRTLGLRGRKLKIIIRQGKEKVIVEKDEKLGVLHNDKEKKTIEACVGEYAEDSDYLNKATLKDYAIVKIQLRPKSDDDLKKWVNALTGNTDTTPPTEDKKACLYLEVDAHSNNTDVDVYYDGTNKKEDGTVDQPKTNKHYWLDRDGWWFQLEVCSCCDMPVGKDGFIDHPKITKKQITALEKYNWKKKVKYIILHRTVSSSATSTLRNFKSGVGTHFLVAKDGTIYQTATLNKTTSHIKNGYNSKTVGIEVVGMPLDKDGKTTGGGKNDTPVVSWETLTQSQIDSVVCLLKGLLKHYNLNKSDIKNHEDLQAKTKGEGKTIYDAIINLIK